MSTWILTAITVATPSPHDDFEALMDAQRFDEAIALASQWLEDSEAHAAGDAELAMAATRLGPSRMPSRPGARCSTNRKPWTGGSTAVARWSRRCGGPRSSTPLATHPS